MLGETKLLSKRFSSVLPIKRQPPEDSTGYMPVCLSAIPTDPAGTTCLGESRRGQISFSLRPPK